MTIGICFHVCFHVLVTVVCCMTIGIGFHVCFHVLVTVVCCMTVAALAYVLMCPRQTSQAGLRSSILCLYRCLYHQHAPFVRTA